MQTVLCQLETGAVVIFFEYSSFDRFKRGIGKVPLVNFIDISHDLLPNLLSTFL